MIYVKMVILNFTNNVTVYDRCYNFSTFVFTVKKNETVYLTKDREPFQWYIRHITLVPMLKYKKTEKFLLMVMKIIILLGFSIIVLNHVKRKTHTKVEIVSTMSDNYIIRLWLKKKYTGKRGSFDHIQFIK